MRSRTSGAGGLASAAGCSAPDDPGRDAERDAAALDVLGDDGPGPDQRAISDVNAIEQAASGADPDVLSDGDSPMRQRLSVHRHVGPREAVVGGHDHRVRADHHVAADGEPAMSIEDAIGANVGIRLDLDRSAVRGEDGAVRDRGAALDADPASPEVAVGPSERSGSRAGS